MRSVYYKLSGKAKTALKNYVKARELSGERLSEYLKKIGSTGNFTVYLRSGNLDEAQFDKDPGAAWKKVRDGWYKLSRTKEAKQIAIEIKAIMGLISQLEARANEMFGLPRFAECERGLASFKFAEIVHNGQYYIQIHDIFKVPADRQKEFERISDIEWDRLSKLVELITSPTSA